MDPEEWRNFTYVPAPRSFLSPNTPKHKEDRKKMPFRFPRILFVIKVSGGPGKWVVLLKSCPFHCSQPWVEKDTFSRLWERRPFLVAPAGIGSVLNQAVSFLWSPVCVHKKSSFPPIGFCLNGCLWYGMCSALLRKYLNPGILLDSGATPVGVRPNWFNSNGLSLPPALD